MTVSASTLQIILAVICGLCGLWLLYAFLNFSFIRGAGKKDYIVGIILAACVLILAACVLSIGYIESKKHQHQVDQLPPMWRELYRQVDQVPRELRNKFVEDAVTKHHFPHCSRKELQLITYLGDVSFSHFERFVNDNPEFHIPEQK